MGLGGGGCTAVCETTVQCVVGVYCVYCCWCVAVCDVGKETGCRVEVSRCNGNTVRRWGFFLLLEIGSAESCEEQTVM